MGNAVRPDIIPVPPRLSTDPSSGRDTHSLWSGPPTGLEERHRPVDSQSPGDRRPSVSVLSSTLNRSYMFLIIRAVTPPMMRAAAPFA